MWSIKLIMTILLTVFICLVPYISALSGSISSKIGLRSYLDDLNDLNIAADHLQSTFQDLELSSAADTVSKVNNYNKHIHNPFSTLQYPHLDSILFTCERLPQRYNPYTFCSGVVDYEFVVSGDSTLTTLDAQARFLAGYFNSFLNGECLSDVKRAICSSVYLQCVPNVVAGNVSTYQWVEGVPLPFMKPCGSLCSATLSTGSTCRGTLEVLQLAPVCTSLSPLGIPQYDYTSTPLSSLSSLPVSGTSPVCNDLPSTKGQALVAEPYEPYIGSTCKGIVQEFFVTNQVNATLAPMLPPFVLQTLSEMAVTALAQAMRPYNKAPCLNAFRQLVCSTALLSPHPTYELAAVLGTVYLPSFPERKICTHYSEVCATVIAREPLYFINCSATAAGSTIEIYPNSSQTIVTLDLGFPLALSSPPHSIDQSAVEPLETVCPIGTVIPDDPSKSSVDWILDSGCALACPLAVYTQDEYAFVYRLNTYIAWLVLALCCLMAVNIAALKASRRNLFLMIAIGCLAVAVVLQLVPLYTAPDTRSILCDSNASYHTLSGTPQSTAAGVCKVTALLAAYRSLLSYWFMLPLSVEIWLRVVKGVKDVKPYRLYYLHCSFASVLLFCLLLTFYGQPDIATGPFFCTWAPPDKWINYCLTTLPSTVYFCTSLLFTSHAIFVCVRVTLRVSGEKNPLRKIWKSYSMLILFLLLFILAYPYFLFYFGTQVALFETKYTEGVVDWLTCLFTHFDGSDSYLATCHSHPVVRMELVPIVSSTAVSLPITVILFYVTLSVDAKTLWKNLLLVVLQKSGFKAAVRYFNSPLLRVKYLSIVQRRSSTVSSSSFSDDTATDVEMALESAATSLKIKPSRMPGKDSVWVNLNRFLLGRVARGHKLTKKKLAMQPIDVKTCSSVSRADEKETAREDELCAADDERHSYSQPNNISSQPPAAEISDDVQLFCQSAEVQLSRSITDGSLFVECVESIDQV